MTSSNFYVLRDWITAEPIMLALEHVVDYGQRRFMQVQYIYYSPWGELLALPRAEDLDVIQVGVPLIEQQVWEGVNIEQEVDCEDLLKKVQQFAIECDKCCAGQILAVSDLDLNHTEKINSIVAGWALSDLWRFASN